VLERRRAVGQLRRRHDARDRGEQRLEVAQDLRARDAEIGRPAAPEQLVLQVADVGEAERGPEVGHRPLEIRVDRAIDVVVHARPEPEHARHERRRRDEAQPALDLVVRGAEPGDLRVVDDRVQEGRREGDRVPVIELIA
jgi:hypothetical protein